MASNNAPTSAPDPAPTPASASAPAPLPPVKLSLPLKFQQEIFQAVRAQDTLVIMARGLGLLRLVTNILHSYDAAGNNLILLMGATDRETAVIGRCLVEQKIVSGPTTAAARARGLTTLDAKDTPMARSEIYQRGGIFAVTSRILIGDMLSGIIRADAITGIVAIHADRFTATSNDAFILRVYREKNRSGFLKAFSDNPEAFTRGFSHLSKMLGSLFLPTVSLWPRFQMSVAASLEGKRRAEVIELEVPLTPAMLHIQNAIKECVELCIHEIRKTNSALGLDLDDWDAKTVMMESFDLMIRRQLEPNWHRITAKTRRIVADLTVLRDLLRYVLEYDCVAFLEHLDAVHEAHSPAPGSLRSSESPWFYFDATHVIFDSAKKRVYAAESLMRSGRDNNNDDDDIDSLKPVLEELPKWSVLADVLDEINTEVQAAGPPKDDSSGAILIMCRATETCRQLRDYLQTMHIRPQDTKHPQPKDNDDDDSPNNSNEASAAFLLRRKLRRYLGRRKEVSRMKAALYADTQKSLTKAVDLTTGQRRLSSTSTANKRRRVRGGGAVGSSSSSRPTRSDTGAVAADTETPEQLSGLISEVDTTAPHEVEQRVDIVQDEFADIAEKYGLLDLNDLVVIHAYDGDSDDSMLEQVKPRYIIMYDVDAPFIRRIEVYRSSHNDRDLRSYLLYYADSVEEERYLSAVRREKDAFTRLIRERASMALTLNEPPSAASSSSQADAFLGRINTRIAGGAALVPGSAAAPAARIVVDIREFRSSLPPLLHGHGIAVVPCHLTVGDYILSPRICVERKAIADLIQSLNSGRLWTQCEAMFRHYATPVLLIEFHQSEAFTLERFADMYSTGGSNNAASASAGSDLQAKLVALTLAFPRLRIIWSSSPYETAEIFQSLKTQESEPEPRAAVEAGLVTGDKEPGDGGLGPALQAMMMAIPGVTPANLGLLTARARSVRDVANMSLEQLAEIVGREAAANISYFFGRRPGG